MRDVPAAEDRGGEQAPFLEGELAQAFAELLAGHVAVGLRVVEGAQSESSPRNQPPLIVPPYVIFAARLCSRAVRWDSESSRRCRIP